MIAYVSIPAQPAQSQTVRVDHTYPTGTRTSNTKTASLPAIAETVSSYEPVVHIQSRDMPISGKFSDVKKSGTVKMTDGSILNRKVENFLGTVERREANTAEAAVYDAHAGTEKNCTAADRSGLVIARRALVTRSYPETGDLAYWKKKYPTVKHYSLKRTFPTNKVEAAKAAAYSELFTAYDLAEELGELRESILYFKGKIDAIRGPFVKNALEYAKILKTKGHKEALSHWMQFRYALMPVIYSAKDIYNLVFSSGSFRTVRKRVYHDAVDKQILPTRGRFFYDLGVDASTVSVTAKAGWSTSDLARLDLINLNPLAAATKLHPYAFMVNWFFNIQDVAYSHLRSLTTTATSYAACVAYKTELQVETFLRETVDDRIDEFHNGWSLFCNRPVYPLREFHYGSITHHDLLLQRITDRSYRRETFSPHDVKIVWNPYLDWKRALDSVALLLPKVEKSIRKLMR